MIILSPKELRKVRMHRKKKQAQIADLLGVKRPTYVGYEKKRDTIEVTAEAANAVAEFLNVDVKDLECRTEVEKYENPLNGGRYRIFEGDYIGLHQLAWDEFQQTLKHERDTLKNITQNNSKLTDSNAKLVENITVLVKLLRPNE